jgi:ribonuclease P protein component
VAVTFLGGGVDAPPRVAYAVGKRVGNAVTRNLVRRRLRAVLADLAPSLRPGAYLIVVAPEAAAMTFGELRAVVCQALQAIRES